MFQSRFSLEKHVELGIELRDPIVIPNAVDPAIFHPPEEREPLDGRRVRVIASSWSVNPRKGSETLAWLDRHLDRDRYEVTFVGQAPTGFEWIRSIGPLPSGEVADELRRHDVYVAASRDDPCSNALARGARLRASRGVPRRAAGIPSSSATRASRSASDEELAGVLDRLVAGLDGFRAAIASPSISSVADRYLEVLGLAPTPTPRIARAVENYLRRAKDAAAFRISTAASTARRSREPTTSSTSPTPGRRRRGSARRP